MLTPATAKIQLDGFVGRRFLMNRKTVFYKSNFFIDELLHLN